MNKQASVDMAENRRKLKEKRNHLAAGDGVIGHDLLCGRGESGHRGRSQPGGCKWRRSWRPGRSGEDERDTGETAAFLM